MKELAEKHILIDEYTLDYNSTVLSAVMLYEAEMERKKKEEKLAQEEQKVNVNQEMITVESTGNKRVSDLSDQQQSSGAER